MNVNSVNPPSVCAMTMRITMIFQYRCATKGCIFNDLCIEISMSWKDNVAKINLFARFYTHEEGTIMFLGNYDKLIVET